MEKKMKNTRSRTRVIVSLMLVLAMFASLFVFMSGIAQGDDTTTTTKDPNKYTVTFDANGGYFNEKDENGNYITQKKRDGYKGLGLNDKTQLTPVYETDAYGTQAKYFDGWSATKDSKVNVDPATYDPERDITVYAVWSDKISVTFDDNKGNKDSKTTYYFDKGDSISVKEIPMPTPYNGKVFSGWYEDQSAQTESLDYGVITPKQSVTYYAGYAEGATIVLNANGGHYKVVAGKNNDGSPNEEYTTTRTIYVTKGKTLNDYDPIPDRNYPAKYFGGYYTDKSFSSDKKVGLNDKITKDMTLYAKWDDTPQLDDYLILTYKIYNTDLKLWEDTQEIRIDVGDTLNKDNYYSAPYKSGLAFVGWYTDMNLTAQAPEFDGSYTPSDDMTFYARYNDTVDISLTYWYANNNGNLMKIDDQTATYVKGISDISTDFTKRFLSDSELVKRGINPNANGISTTWYADKAHTKVVNGKSDLTIDKNGHADIYGVLVKRQAITLNTPADIGGDILHNDNVISTAATKGAKYIKATAYVNYDMALSDAAKYYRVDNIDSKKMKDFVGWTETEGSTTLVGTTVSRGVENLYAVIGNAYTVTVNLNGGYDRAANDTDYARRNVITKVIAEGKKVDTFLASINPRFYYADNKKFKEWTLDQEGKNVLDVDTYTVTENVTIYAQWETFDESDPEDTYTGIRKQTYNGEEAWWRVVDGKVDPNATGIFKNEYGWWRVENGKVNFNAQEIYKNEYGWWKTTDGKVTFNETGIFKNQYGWWRVVNSKVDFTANGIYKNQYGWWKTTNGKVTFNETGVFSNEYGTWYCENSKVNFNYNGTVKYNGKTYTVTNGKAKLA